MALGPVADQVVVAETREIHAHRDPVLDRRLGRGDDPLPQMQRMKLGIAETHDALAQAQLRQARARAHQNREGSRRNLREKLAVVPGTDRVEFLRPIGDDAGEHVDPAGRTFRVSGRRKIRRKRKASCSSAI